MTEEEYAALHAHPSPDYIAQNLQQRMDSVQREAVQEAQQRQLEEMLQKQNDTSGRGQSLGGSGSAERKPRVPKSLEYPIIQASLLFRGSTDTRQVSDWVREWEAISLYVHDDFKVAHLITAIAEPVKATLKAALATTRYNNGQGYLTLAHAPMSEIIHLMKEIYDQPDYLYRAVLRWKNHAQRPDQSLEQYLRARDQLNNQLSAYGILVDETTSKYMLVGAVKEAIRRDLMREKNWHNLTESQMVQSMKTKELAVSTASAGGRQHAWQPAKPPQYNNSMRGQLMVASAAQEQPRAQTTPSHIPGRGVRPKGNAPFGQRVRQKASQPFDVGHYAYSTRMTPQAHMYNNQRRNQQPQRQQNGGPARTANTIQRDRGYNLRDRPQQKGLGQKDMKHLYHPSQWARRVDPATNRLRPTAAPYLPANKELYRNDVDQFGNKYCIFCKEPHHNLTECSKAHAAWKQRAAK